MIVVYRNNEEFTFQSTTRGEFEVAIDVTARVLASISSDNKLPPVVRAVAATIAINFNPPTNMFSIREKSKPDSTYKIIFKSSIRHAVKTIDLCTNVNMRARVSQNTIRESFESFIASKLQYLQPCIAPQVTKSHADSEMSTSSESYLCSQSNTSMESVMIESVNDDDNKKQRSV